MKTTTKRQFNGKQVGVITKTSHRLSAKEVKILKAFFKAPIYDVVDCLDEKEAIALDNLEELELIQFIEDSFRPQYELHPSITLEELKSIVGV